MLWVLAAVLLSINAAAFVEANRYFKQDGFRLNFWRTLVATVLLLPTLPFLHWPKPGLFYPMAVLTGVVIIISTTVRFNLAAKQNGRVTTLWQPLAVLVSFALWIASDTASFHQFTQNPLQTALILLCFAITFGGMFLIRQNDASWKAFVIVAPLGLLHGVADTLAKHALVGIDMIYTGYTYVFISFLTSTVCSAFLLAWRRNNRALCPPGMLRAAGVLGILGLIGFYVWLLALSLAPSPAYVTMISMLTPVWLLIYHKLSGYKDDANPWAGLVMLTAAAGLVAVTQLW